MDGRRVADEKRELVLSLLRRGRPYVEIIELSGVSDSTVYRIRKSLGGMIRPLDAEYVGRYLGRDERYEIARLHDAGLSIRAIAHRLGRAAIDDQP